MPSALAEYMQSSRDFACVRLSRPGVAHICGIRALPPGTVVGETGGVRSSAALVVVFADGLVQEFAINDEQGGECPVVSSNRITLT